MKGLTSEYVAYLLMLEGRIRKHTILNLEAVIMLR